MSIELVEAVISLGMILDEENARLQAPGYDPLMSGLVTAKTRLAGIIEAEHVRLTAASEDWSEGLDAGAATDLRTAIQALFAKLDLNQQLLRRRIALCDDLLAVLTTEAKRAAGGRSTVYGAKGALNHADQATPIAVNSKY
jgi:hypothetical protein